MGQKKRHERLMSMTRFLSMVVSVSMVLSLMPSQGLVWAQQEATEVRLEALSQVQDNAGELTPEDEDVSGGTPAQAKPPEPGQMEAKLVLRLENAVLTYDGYDFDAEFQELTVPLDIDMVFAVKVDDGYEIARVTYEADDDEIELTAREAGTYFIAKDDLKDGATIAVATEAISEQETEPVPTHTKDDDKQPEKYAAEQVEPSSVITTDEQLKDDEKSANDVEADVQPKTEEQPADEEQPDVKVEADEQPKAEEKPVDEEKPKGEEERADKTKDGKRLEAEDEGPPEEESSVPVATNSRVREISDTLRAQGAESTNLANFLTNVSLSAHTNEQGQYVVKPGEDYTIRLSFAETNGGLQFDNDGPLTYQIPGDIHVDEQSGSLNINLKIGTKTYKIQNNPYSISETGLITFNWNIDDPNYARLTGASNTHFDLYFEGDFTNERDKIVFSDSVEKDIHVDRSNSVTASKSASVDRINDKLWYTVSVRSSGNSVDVKLTDVLTGTGLTLDADSFSASSSKGGQVSGTTSVDGNSFEYTLGDMSDGEVITVRYSATIDPSVLQKLENGKVVTTTNNSVKVVSHDDPENEPINVRREIDYTPTIEKSGAVDAGTTVDGKKILKWTVTYNGEAKVNAKSGSITDSIKESSRNIMTMYGDGIKITKKNRNGETVSGPTEVAWDQGQLTKLDEYSWRYVVPENEDGPYKYIIEYETQVDVSEIEHITAVDNTATTEDHQESTGTGKVGPNHDVPLIRKSVEKIDLANREVTWTASINVPKEGLTKAVITDTYPTSFNYDTMQRWYDVVKEGSVEVTGLVDGEDKQVSIGATSATITLTHNGQPGLAATDSSRVVTVTLKTNLTEEWLEFSKEHTDRRTRVNNISLDYGTDTITDTATVVVAAPEVKKSVQQIGTRTVNGIELPIYQYVIKLFGLENVHSTIEDTFDTSLLEVYRNAANGFWVYVGTQYEGDVDIPESMDSTDLSHTTGVPCTYVDTADGITITTNADALKKGHDGNPNALYPIYGIVYYLTIKDASALNKIMGYAAQSENGYDLTNSAEWGGQTGIGKVTFGYEGLTKELLTSEEELSKVDDDIWADFQITLNPGAQRLNDGDPLVMTDKVEGLSVDLASIKAVQGEILSCDMDDDTVTYTVPDATKVVIRYRAKVVYDNIGEPHTTVDVHFKNTATMEGYSDYVEGDAHRYNSGEGQASIPVIHILKYEAGNLGGRLNGAVFELLDANKQPITDKYNRPVTVTTQRTNMGTDEEPDWQDGVARVQGDETTLGWNLESNTVYYLHEISAPDGFMLDDTYYEFMISEFGETDYTAHPRIYYSGDNMTVKNYPGTDVTVEKVWADGNENHESEEVTAKLQQRIKNNDGDWGPWSDTIRKEVMQGDEYVWVDTTEPTTIVLKKEQDESKSWKGAFYSLPLDVPAQLPATERTEDVIVEYRVIETKVGNREVIYDGDDYTQGTYDGGTASISASSGTGGTYQYTIINSVEETEASIEASKILAPWVDGNAFDLRLVPMNGRVYGAGSHTRRCDECFWSNVGELVRGRCRRYASGWQLQEKRRNLRQDRSPSHCSRDQKR